MVAAVVNGLVVLCLPWILPALIGPSGSNTAHASPWLAAIINFIQMVSLFAPPAALAVWRTYVHAEHWLDGRRCWHGVLEAGLVPFIVAFGLVGAAVSVNWFRRPIVALGYVTFYATVASLVGLVVGVILQLTAMIVLTASSLIHRVADPG